MLIKLIKGGILINGIKNNFFKKIKTNILRKSKLILKLTEVNNKLIKSEKKISNIH